MNTKTLYGLGILVATVSACSTAEQEFKDEALFTKEQKEIIITAAVESQPETRTILNSNNLSVLWKPADEIKVFSAGEASKFISQNSENKKAVNFLGTISVITGTAEGTDIDTHIYGLYPYTDEATMTDGSFTTTLPPVQTGVAETFDDDLFISIGRSYTFSMGFWNVCSGYRFSFTEGGYQSVTLTSNDGTPLAGTFVVTFDDNGKPVITSNPAPSSSVTMNAPEGGFVPNTFYYLVVLPGTHASGLTFTATNASGTGTYAINEEKTFTRSKFKQVVGLDELLSLPQSNKEIWYISSNNEVVVPKYDDGFGATLQNNTYENGKGVMTFDADITSIGRGAFNGCSTMTSISIPESVVSLGNAAFAGTMISEIVLPSGISTVPESAFLNCSVLESITLPNDLVSIERSAFAGCTNLSSVSLPSNVETLGIGAFSGSGLTEITLPNSITSAGENCFMDCVNLQTVTLSTGLSDIASAMFRGCSQLSTVVIPNSISRIESAAFWQCTSLPAVFTIPSSVNWIKDKAFYGCSSIEKVYIMKETGANIEKDAFKDCPCYLNMRVFVPASALSKYVTNSNSVSYLNISHICAIEAESIEPVDLGLSVKWAPCDIGATQGTETGYFFQWGEIEQSNEASLNDYKWWDGNSYTKYTKYSSTATGGDPDGKTTLDSEDNAALMNWGGVWTMPTKEQVKELIDNCTITAVYKPGYSGLLWYIIVEGPNGNIIRFPRTQYWTKNLYYSDYYQTHSDAYTLYFVDQEDDDLYARSSSLARWMLAGVRPVWVWTN